MKFVKKAHRVCWPDLSLKCILLNVKRTDFEVENAMAFMDELS